MSATPTPMHDRNVAFFTISRTDAAGLIRDLAAALAESGEINMVMRTNRVPAAHEISIAIRDRSSAAVGTITDSAMWDE